MHANLSHVNMVLGVITLYKDLSADAVETMKDQRAPVGIINSRK